RLDSRDWRVLGQRHEVTAIALHDPRDETLPDAGWIELEDLESGRRELIDSSNAKVRLAYQRDCVSRRAAVEKVLADARCPLVTLRADRPWMPTLMHYFATRRRGRARSAA